MSKRKGKQMSNLPHSYIEAMEGLQMENEQLRKRILTLENQAKNNEVLDLVSKCELTGKDLIGFSKWITSHSYEHRLEIIPNQLIKFYLNSRDSIIENNDVC